VLDQDLLPELVQDDLSPAKIHSIVSGIMNDPEKMKAIKTELHRLKSLLSSPKPSSEMPKLIRTMLGV